MNIVRGVVSWLHRNPVQVAAIVAGIVGVLNATGVIEIGEDDAQATVNAVLAVVFVVFGLPAAVRTKVGTTSTGGWFKS